MENNHRKCRLVILISGRGSNMQKIVESCCANDSLATVCAVISNDKNSKGLEWAREKGIKTFALNHNNYATRELFDFDLIEQIDSYQPDYILLAGFMRILTEGFVNHYNDRLINIHPSLLPSFTGLNTHKQALEKGVSVHGCTVHFVNSKLDDGPIIAQGCIPVLANDNETSLAKRVLEIEHKIFPLVVDWLANGKVRINEKRKVEVEGENRFLFAEECNQI